MAKPKDKEKKAVALKYEAQAQRAPKVVGKGRGKVAEHIIRIAQENDIPLHEDKDLAQMLEALDIDTEIPPKLYKAVAEVLALIYRLNKEKLGTLKKK